MSVPRFLLVADAGPRRAVDDGAAAFLAATGFTWRLVAGNNRLLGQSPDRFPDHQACWSALGLLLARVGEAVPRTAPGSGPGRWSWQLCLPGPDDGRTVLAVSARSYERQRESRYGLEAFLEAVPVGLLPTTVGLRSRDRGARRREVPLPVTPLPRLAAEAERGASQPRTGTPAGAGPPLPPE